jgi:hypothetical protein
MSALDGIESEWRALYDVQRATSYYPSYSSWMAYGTSFIGTIIENLQVPLFYSLRIQVTKLNYCCYIYKIFTVFMPFIERTQ